MLFKTKSGKGHHHLFFVPDGEEQGYSIGGDHDHEIRVINDTPFVLSSSVDPDNDIEQHDHEVSEVKNVPPPKIPDDEDEEKLEEVFSLFRSAYDMNLESYENALESEKFRCGDQWDARDRQLLRQNNRACLTINESGAQLDTLLGYQRNNRSDVKHRPIEASDAKVGQLLDEITKNIMETNNFIYEESCVAEDQMVTGRGNFNVYIDFDKNIEGDIVIEKASWKDIFYGPYDKLDRSDLEYLIKQKMYSKERLKRMFPDKADDIQQDYQLWQVSKEKHTISGQGYSLETGRLTISGNDLVKLDIAKKEYRLVELWRKQFRTEYVLVDLQRGTTENITGVDKRTREKLGEDERYRVIARTVYDIRVTKVAGNVLLSDEIVDVPDNDFDVIPVHAKYYNSKWWGKMEEMKDLQREINHRHSQVVDIINKSVSYMWMTDPNTFDNPHDESEFYARANEAGFVARVSDTARPPIKSEGGKVPVEVVQLMNLSTEKLHKISNVPMETQGASSRELSGVAIREKTQVALQSNRYLFDNMNLAKKLIANKVVALVKEYYSPERIIRLIRSNNPYEPDAQGVNGISDEDIIRLLNTEDLTKYDVVVDTSPYSPTTRMSNQILLQELMKQGVPIPMPYFIEQSDLPNKEGLLGMFAQQQQQQADQQKSEQETEIQKTLIARSGRQQGGQ